MVTLNDMDRVRTPEAWHEHLMQRVEKEKTSATKRAGRRVRTGLLIAAVVAVLGIGITAVAGNLWNNSGKGYHPTLPELTDQENLGKNSTNETLTWLPWMLDENDPQYQAMTEWNKARLKPDPLFSELSGEIDEMSKTVIRYYAYWADTPLQEKELEDIADKYDLELITWQEAGDERLSGKINALGLTNWPVSSIASNGSHYYSDGSFYFETNFGGIGQLGETGCVRVSYASRTTMPPEYWITDLTLGQNVSTFTVGEQEGYVFRRASAVTFLMRFDDAYAVAYFSITPDIEGILAGRVTSTAGESTAFTDEDVQMLCGAINWEKFRDIRLKEGRLYQDVSAIHADYIPQSVSPDLEYPYYGTFKHRTLETVYEYYPDHFSCNGVRYDNPVYTVTGTYDPYALTESEGVLVYTSIDVDCGDNVHFSIIISSRNPDRVGFYGYRVIADNVEYINSRRQ